MSNEARIGLTVELQALRKQLQESGDLTSEQAARMVGELNKSMKSAEKAHLAAAKAAKEAKGKVRELGDEYKRAGDAAGAVGRNSQKLAGILGMVSPEAAEVARSLNDLGDSGEVLAEGAGAAGVSLGTVGAVLGTVGVAAGSLYLAWKTLHEEEEQDARITEAIAEARKQLQPLFDAEKRALIDLRVASGQLSEEEGAALKTRMDLHGQLGAALEGSQKKITELHEANTSWTTSLADGIARTAAFSGYIAPLAWLLDGVTTSTSENITEIRKLADGQEQLATETKGAITTIVKAGEEMGSHAASTRAADAALQSLNAEMERQKGIAEANLATFAQVGEEQEALEASARRAIATGVERMAMDRKAAEATAERLLQERLAVAATESAKEEAHAAHRKALRAIDAQYDKEEADALAKKQADADAAAARAIEQAKRQAEEARRAGIEMTNAIAGYAQQALTAGADAAGSASDQAAATARSLEEQLAASEEHLTERQKAELRKRADAAKQAAIEQFNTSKGLKMAEATAAAGLAVINQLATNPGAFGIAASIAAGAAGAASIAAIAGTQLTLHKGGEVMAPDEVGVTARKNEFMLTPTGRSTLGSDAELNRANAGVSPSAAPTYVVTQYQHSRLASRYKDDGIKRNDPVSQAINKRLGAVGME